MESSCPSATRNYYEQPHSRHTMAKTMMNITRPVLYNVPMRAYLPDPNACDMSVSRA